MHADLQSSPKDHFQLSFLLHNSQTNEKKKIKIKLNVLLYKENSMQQ